ncbi:hypothetical protein AD006_12325 [Pseudonocardia sp. EC080610-09]|uniref:hypothetical protein n=1 Tax=unclassified Pseudonocardia TaxID=2619320 RepID=UPI0006CB5195|nr:MULTISPECIES: hypothetical protein [unclassified Pseudonocardia]ALE72578.1 hypothetical protein FRP1_04665 [Pseudonocardia sp. EC080625-04]ALL75892.1 hypothetical protein AD006_12325 [Pseudonocardia sp. EC080610-09]ALL82919.1 hypothetical protein AD017_20150 [Pseudonocardia sp. EC080619-01]
MIVRAEDVQAGQVVLWEGDRLEVVYTDFTGIDRTVLRVARARDGVRQELTISNDTELEIDAVPES